MGLPILEIGHNFLLLFRLLLLLMLFCFDASQKCMNDWEIFTKAMASIFNSLLNYVIRDQHSVPSMLSPIPYAKVNHGKIRLPSEKVNV